MKHTPPQGQPAVQRGRPRGFCCEAALEAALRVFWERGYAGASLDELTTAMGINRPSLYAAFGNKETLFKKVLQRYGDRSACMATSAMTEPTAYGFTEKLLRNVATLLADSSHPSGCLSLQSGMALGHGAAAVKDALLEQRKQLQCLFAKRFACALSEGELPVGTDVGALARFYAVVTHGMSVQATMGVTKEELESVVAFALRAWPDRDALVS